MATLPHDAGGFLIGERLASGIDLVGRDTTEILKILKGAIAQHKSTSNRLRVTLDHLNNHLARQTIDVSPAPAPIPNQNPRNNLPPAPAPTVDVGSPSNGSPPIPPTVEPGQPPRQGGNQAGGAPEPAPAPGSGQPPTIEPGANSVPDAAPTPGEAGPGSGGGRIQRRDSNGRFSGDGLGGSWWQRMKRAVSEGVATGNADTHNIDPTVDAVRELGDAMSPLTKVGRFMFKGAAWLFRRKKRQDPPSDQEQRQQTRIEKLLKRIAESRVGQAAGSGLNLFGGLFSSLGGALSSAGGLASMIVGGLGKLLIPALGLTGAFKLGEWIGGKIYDYIEPTLSPLIDGIAAIPDKMTKAWQGVVDIASRGIENVVDTVRGVKRKVTEAYDSSVDFVSRGIESAANVFKGKPSSGFTPDKAKAIQETALRLGVNPNDLAQIISFESAGSFDPAKKNAGGSGATGLIQFMPTVAKEMGTTTDELAAMSFDDQMLYVERYLAGRGIGKNNKTSLADMYNAVQGVPKAGYKAGTPAYEKNKVWDVNKDGVILPDEAVNGAGFKAHAKNYFPDYGVAAKALPSMPAVSAMVNAPLSYAGIATSPTITRTVAPAMPMAVPKLLARPIPAIPAVKQQVSTAHEKPMQVVIAGGSDSIGQNIADRHLAHAVTGGLGMDTLRVG